MKDLSVEKQIYLCKYHDVDTYLLLNLGLKKDEAEELLEKYKQNGLYEQYRNMDEYEYDRICKQEKRKDKYEKILDRYRFNKTRSTYTRMLDMLRECSLKKETNINRICKIIASRQNIEPYVINNDCKRAMDSAYKENTKIFETYGYMAKPTLKEFITKELGLQDAKSEENTSKEITEKSKESVKSTDAPCENVISDITKITMDSKIEISLKELLDYYYLKGFVDAIEGKEM